MLNFSVDLMLLLLLVLTACFNDDCYLKIKSISPCHGYKIRYKIMRKILKCDKLSLLYQVDLKKFKGNCDSHIHTDYKCKRLIVIQEESTNLVHCRHECTVKDRKYTFICTTFKVV